jgi:K+-sensing histidine kinase KdpD
MTAIPINVFTVSSIIAAIICWLLAVLIYSNSRGNSVKKSFVRVTALIGVWTLFPLATSLPVTNEKALFLARFIYISAIFVPATFFSFMFYVLGLKVIKTARIILRASYIIAIGFLIFGFSRLFIADIARFMPESAIIPGPLYIFYIIYFVFIYSYASLKLLWRYKESSGYSRMQLKYIGLAFAFATISGFIHFLSAFKIKEIFPHDILVATYSLIMAYAVIRYRLMDIRIAVIKIIIAVSIYSVIFSVPILLSTIFRSELFHMAADRWWLIPIFLYTVAIVFAPFLYQKLKKMVEDEILKDQHHNHTALTKTARGIPLVRNFESLVNSIVNMVTETLGIKWASIYLVDRDKKNYSFCVTKGGKSCDVKIDSAHVLIKYLTSTRKPIVLEELKREYEDRHDIFIKEIIDIINKLEADVLVPFLIENDLIGFLALGPKKSGGIYSNEDLNILSNLADQAALAIENAQFLKEREEMQGKLREAETLTTIRDLLGSFNHELYNLLSPVAGTLQSITMGDYDKRPERLKPDAQKGVEKTFFIKTYLGWVREYVESGNRIAAYQLSELVNGGISYLKDNIEKQNIKTQVNISPKIFVVGYESLPLLFRNLIIHSVYGYGMEHDGTINISACILEDGATVEIIQHDTGDDLTKYIQEGSTMGGKKFAEKGKLGGVNYYIAQAIVSKHKGIFKVEPTGGKGTKFNIRLPLDFNKVSP